MTETPVNDRSLLKIISVHNKLMYWNISSLSKAYNYYIIKHETPYLQNTSLEHGILLRYPMQKNCLQKLNYYIKEDDQK